MRVRSLVAFRGTSSTSGNRARLPEQDWSCRDPPISPQLRQRSRPMPTRGCSFQTRPNQSNRSCASPTPLLRISDFRSPGPVCTPAASKSGGPEVMIPLLGLPLTLELLAISSHSSGIKVENRAVIAGARFSARRPLHAGDSRSTHESRRHARRLPAARASTASGTFPTASGDRCSPCSVE